MASLYERISKGTLAVSEITAAMQAATSEGGKYYQSMEKQSQTISGMFSTVKDNLQQLGGDLFAPFTDSLRTTILPGTISIIDEISAAFKARGVDGIIAVINQQTPKLISEASKLAKKAMTGVTKTLPTLVKGLLPDLIKGAVDLAPDIGDMLFDLLAEGVEFTVASLPTLIPMLAGGIFDLFGAVFDGAFKIAGGLFSGLNKALKQMGVLEWSPEELINQSFENVDKEHVKDIIAKINVNPEVEVTEDPTVELKSIYDQIAEQLTDGLADTEEVVEGLKTKVTEYYQGQIDKINEWRDAALEGLDSTLPKEEYDAAAAEINAQADSIIANLGAASDTAVAFVDEMAGKPTAIVEANLSTLEGYLEDAKTIVEQVGELVGITGMTVQDAQREIVAQGLSKDEGVQINAIASTAQEYASAVEQAEAVKAQALIDAARQYAQGTDQYVQLEEAANAAHDEAMASAQQTLMENMSLLWQGIAKALDPETAALIDEATAKQRMSDRLAKIFGGMQEALNNPDGLPSDPVELQALVASMFEGSGMTDAEWAAIAEQMDMDPAALKTALMEMIAENLQGASFGGNLMSPVEMLQLGEWLTIDPSALTGLSDKIAPVMQAAIDAGLLNGIEGIDLSNPSELISFLLMDFGEYTAATIGKEVGEGVEDTEVTAKPKVDVETPEVDASGVTEEVTQATQEAADSTEPVETTQQVNATTETTVTTTDDSGIEEAVNAELATQTMNVGVNAAVSLNVTVSDSNAATVGTTVGQQIGDAIAEGVSSKSEAVSTAASTLGNSAASGARAAYDQMKSAGSYAGQGFQLGLASKRTAILQTARGIANSVASVIKMALDINSPSGVTMALGAYTGEGFDIGLSRSLNKAVRNAEHIVSTMNLAPRMSYPDIEGALSTAASGAYSAEASRPIYLAVNGRILAQAISRDMQIAGNNYNRSVALGVGK